MLTTNENVSRVLADDGKRRIVTTSNMKRTKVPVMRREWPGVHKVAQAKPVKTFYQTSELEELRKKRAAEMRAAGNAATVSEPAQATQPAEPEKPKRTYRRKATRKAKD